MKTWDEHKAVLLDLAQEKTRASMGFYDESDSVKAALDLIDRLAARVAELEADKTALAGGWATCFLIGITLQDRVAELEKGPAVLVQERGPYWHAFESSDDAEAFYQDPSSPGILVKHVASWTHHPASKPEPAEEGKG